MDFFTTHPSHLFKFVWQVHTVVFIYFWLCCVFSALRGLSLVAGSGGYSLVEHGLSYSMARGISLDRVSVSPALAGRFFTTEPPGKSTHPLFWKKKKFSSCLCSLGGHWDTGVWESEGSQDDQVQLLPSAAEVFHRPIPYLKQLRPGGPGWVRLNLDVVPSQIASNTPIVS